MGNKKLSKEKLVLAHLESGKTITPIEALNLYRSFRLAAIICELRKQGHNIITKDDKNSYATYELILSEVA